METAMEWYGIWDGRRQKNKNVRQPLPKVSKPDSNQSNPRIDLHLLISALALMIDIGISTMFQMGQM
jgi:hypothetical protein